MSTYNEKQLRGYVGHCLILTRKLPLLDEDRSHDHCSIATESTIA
jgi:hypothetical protein